jgi:hypothetical protein
VNALHVPSPLSRSFHIHPQGLIEAEQRLPMRSKIPTPGFCVPFAIPRPDGLKHRRRDASLLFVAGATTDNHSTNGAGAMTKMLQIRPSPNRLQRHEQRETEMQSSSFARLASIYINFNSLLQADIA